MSTRPWTAWARPSYMRRRTAVGTRGIEQRTEFYDWWPYFTTLPAMLLFCWRYYLRELIIYSRIPRPGRRGADPKVDRDLLYYDLP